MDTGFPVNETIRKRYSVRTYEKRKVNEDLRGKILEYADSIQNPLGPKANFRFIDKSTADKGEKLGTYGVIRGAELYLGATIKNNEYAMEALGYEFEQLILYITSLGLGTCWLGGTFNKGAFKEAMNVKENELIPIITPVGYPSDKRSFIDVLFRGSTKGDRRRDWNEIFFSGDFSTPLSRKEAGEYEFPLDMLRLAPSAVNGQPWRVVFDGNAFHFFEKHSIKKEESSPVDLQRLDVGIAICHFHLAAAEKGLKGKFERNMPENIAMPDGMNYIVSWVTE